uniref:Plac8 onzin related protein 2 n=1 Tax=Sinocyclocheilus grahami TaxID=75366 RepID=A0A672NNP3_SINGR
LSDPERNLYQPQFSPVIAVSSNQWSTGIFGCFDDCSVCCFAIWCPFCFICSTASDFGEFCCLPMIDNCACTPPVSMALRASVRNRYGIQVCVAQKSTKKFHGSLIGFWTYILSIPL